MAIEYKGSVYEDDESSEACWIHNKCGIFRCSGDADSRRNDSSCILYNPNCGDGNEVSWDEFDLVFSDRFPFDNSEPTMVHHYNLFKYVHFGFDKK